MAAPVLGLSTLTIGTDTPQSRKAGFSLLAADGVLMVLGPSAGHWYAGEIGTTGLAVRAGSAAVLTAGMVGLYNCAQIDANCGRGGDYAVVGAITIGGIGLIFGTILDVFDAGEAAHRWNRAHGIEPILAPMVTSSGGGLSLAGQF